MQYSVQAKGFELSPAQDFIIKKGISKLLRYCKNFNDDAITAQVMVSYHNPPKNFGTHIFLEVPGNKMSAVTNGFKFNQAYNEVVEKILSQLRKHKAKLQRSSTFAEVAQAHGKA